MRIISVIGVVAACMISALFLLDAPESVPESRADVPVPVVPEWKPRKREFTLDDGTRCVAVSTRTTNFPTDSGFSGISCNWKNKD